MPSLGPEARRALIRAANENEFTAEEVDSLFHVSEIFYNATGINPITETDAYMKFYVEKGHEYADLEEEAEDPEPDSDGGP